ALREALVAAQAEREDARQAVERRNALALMIRDEEKAIQELSDRWSEQREAEGEAARTVDRLEAELRAARLPFETLEAAQTALDEELAAAARIERAVEQAREALAQSHRDLAQQEALRDRAAEEQTLLVERLAEQRELFQNALGDQGLADEAEYRLALAAAEGVSADAWLLQARGRVSAYEKERAELEGKLQELDRSIGAESPEPTEPIRQAVEDTEAELRRIGAQEHLAALRLRSHQRTQEAVAAALRELKRTEKAAVRLRRMSALANEAPVEGGVLSFDRYVMGAFFREVLAEANQRLAVLSRGKYQLRHLVRGDRKNSQTGFQIEVQDAFTGESRRTETLSGGESFQVSLSLALGLSAVVQARAGGKQVEAMFIDEGFGSLDDAVLTQALAVLSELAGDRRQIGIISHVDRLRESIPRQIVVTSGRSGSSLKII
ncbi:MAG: hypothetical protein IJ240_02290, partial [Clostridia bacterium]|nr:hypothetical protein [Clostridia bacterium]